MPSLTATVGWPLRARSHSRTCMSLLRAKSKRTTRPAAECSACNRGVGTRCNRSRPPRFSSACKPRARTRRNGCVPTCASLGSGTRSCGSARIAGLCDAFQLPSFGAVQILEASWFIVPRRNLCFSRLARHRPGPGPTADVARGITGRARAALPRAPRRAARGLLRGPAARSSRSPSESATTGEPVRARPAAW